MTPTAEQMTTLDWVLCSSMIVIVWAIVIRWFWRRHPNAGMPIGLIPFFHYADQVIHKMQLRRHQRIRAFLQLADDLWMRKQRVDGFLPRRPGR